MTLLAPASPSTVRLSNTTRVVIVGGGLAGMAAAVALETTGARVTLLEARRTLGGRAGSFEDPQTGEELDNCQHVLLGCCTNLIDFYRRVGVLDRIVFEPAIHFFDPRGRRFDLKAVGGLPAPLHLGPAMLRFNALSWVERIALSRAMLAMMRLGRQGRPALADVPFGQWLDELRQPAGLVEKLYEPILTGALNEQCRLASASYAIQVFQDSLLAHAAGYRLGLPGCPLGQLYAKLPCRDVRLGARVAGLRFAVGGVTGVDLIGGEFLPADSVVLATNHHTLGKWVPAEQAARDPRFRAVESLQDVPILGAHLWFDRPVMSETHAAFMGSEPQQSQGVSPRAGRRPDSGIETQQSRGVSPRSDRRSVSGIETQQSRGVSPRSDRRSVPGTETQESRGVSPRAGRRSVPGPLQWLFRKDAAGNAVHGVISAAREWVGRPKDECLRLFEAHVRSIFPEARDARLERGVIVIEKRATYSPLPGSDRHRPDQAPPPGGIENLFLAGDYTKTGWPATMEGAVRSGYLAAEAVLKRAGAAATRSRFLRDNLPVQWPGKMVSKQG